MLHSVNTTPEENFHWELLVLFYPSSSSSVVFSVLWGWYSVRETRQMKFGFWCSVILWQHHIPALWSCCCLDCFSLMQQVLFHWSTSITVSERFSRLQCLIWLPWKCPLCEMSHVALCLQKSHHGWHSTPLELSLMHSEVTAWDQVQVQITLCYWQLSDPLCCTYSLLHYL